MVPDDEVQARAASAAIEMITACVLGDAYAVAAAGDGVAEGLTDPGDLVMVAAAGMGAAAQWGASIIAAWASEKGVPPPYLWRRILVATAA